MKPPNVPDQGSASRPRENGGRPRKPPGAPRDRRESAQAEVETSADEGRKPRCPGKGAHTPDPATCHGSGRRIPPHAPPRAATWKAQRSRRAASTRRKHKAAYQGRFRHRRRPSFWGSLAQTKGTARAGGGRRAKWSRKQAPRLLYAALTIAPPGVRIYMPPSPQPEDAS